MFAQKRLVPANLLPVNLLPVNVEKNDEKGASKAGYVAPRMFAVGSTVELIQGFAPYGWFDARSGYHHN